MTLPEIIIESKEDGAYCGIILDEKDFNKGENKHLLVQVHTF